MSYQPIPQKAEDTAAASGDKGVPVLAVRADTDSASAADGDYIFLAVDEEGRLKVASKAVSYPDITGNITAVQAVISTPVAGGTVEGDVSRVSNVMMLCSGTFSTINCTFEGSLESSGDTSWFGIQAVRSNANTIETTTGNLSAQPAYGWELSVNALKRVRVRCTARTSGTQAWRMVLGTYATEPIPAAQVSATQPVSGTVTATATMAANATTTPAKARDVASGANDTGIPAFMIRRDTPTTVTPVAGDWEIPQIDSMGAQWVREKASTTSAVTSVAASATSVAVLALNAQRRGATIHNDSTAILYLKLGATASATSFTIKMQPDSYYEVPAQYTGVIDGIWASATGSARVTEITS